MPPTPAPSEPDTPPVIRERAPSVPPNIVDAISQVREQMQRNVSGLRTEIETTLGVERAARSSQIHAIRTMVESSFADGTLTSPPPPAAAAAAPAVSDDGRLDEVERSLAALHARLDDFDVQAARMVEYFTDRTDTLAERIEALGQPLDDD